MSAFSAHAHDSLCFVFCNVQLFNKLFRCKTELVIVDKIVFARVVRRVDVNALYLLCV